MSIHTFPTRFGKYILLDRLNSGGMAEVFRAKMRGAEHFQRLIAIKCMLPQLGEDSQFISMFVDEAKLAAQLSHANIVQIYELGRYGDQLYIAMELVNGRDLRDIIRRAAAHDRQISVGFAAYVLSKAAEALDYAHHKKGVDGTPLGLVHRDVSPQNILVSFDGEVKLVDFGIAKAEVRATETRAGVLKGKFAYMSPEQVVGDVVDHRADIFALGAVLFEVLSGRKLFTGDSDFSLLEKVRHVEAPRLRDVWNEAPPEVEGIINHAIAREPKLRYPTAAEFAEALVPFRLTDRTIFEAKNAAAFMAELYAEEMIDLENQLRDDAQIEIGDEESTRREGTPRGTNEVFETNFREDPRTAETEIATGTQSVSSGWTTIMDERGFGEEYSQSTRLSPLLAESSTFDARTGDDAELNEATPALQRPQVLPYEASDPQFAGNSGSGKILWILSGLAAVMIIAITTLVLSRQSSIAIQAVETPPTVAPVPAKTPSRNPTLTPPPPTTVAVPEPIPLPLENEPPLIEPTKPKPKPRPNPIVRPRKRLGFLSVKAQGVRAARVFVDGKNVGYAPLVYFPVRMGRRRIKIVEMRDGTPGKSKTLQILVTPEHTKKAPLKLVVAL